MARTDPDFFEAMYREDAGHDPWGFADDDYEQGRYRTLDELLGRRRFARALEPGCSIGAFTRVLAARCDRIDAIDVSPTAVGEAARRNADLPQAHHEVGAFPAWALARDHRYDLVCLVEIGYYFAADELERITRDVVERLVAPGGVVLVSHWTGHSDDHVLRGQQVQDVIAAVLESRGFERTRGPRVETGFVAEVWQDPRTEPSLRTRLAAGELDLPRPGAGATRSRLASLREWGREDLSLGRLAEAHTDAVAILGEAGGGAVDGAVYGVWASERPGTSLVLDESGPEPLVTGTKDFCSGVDLCDRALVTAHRTADPGNPVLLEVDLRAAASTGTSRVSTSAWRSPALASTRTGSITFESTPVAAVVGAPGWYLHRPGFWHGAIGPAAVWAGGALGLIDHALARARHGPHVDAHLGALRAIGWQLQVVLDAAADEIDADPDDRAGDARARALSVRHLVERAATEVLDRFGRALGPGPLAYDAAVAERHAALALYIRQSHAEADLEDLERAARREGGVAP